VGAGPYSLRSADQTAFSLSDLKKGVFFAHKQGVKVYLAMNIFSYDSDLPKMINYLKKAITIGIDAVIVTDPGLVYLIRKINKKIKIHLSTQANTLNSSAVKFWKEQGVSRIVLGRELTLKQVNFIRKAVPNIELELFIHGAMCMSYSGRCLLSKHMTGRSANRGDCTHPCRWEYTIKEAKREDEEFRIEEDPRGTYILNSKDLCLIEHIPELVKAGINSFKIEGRMKSVYYVAVVAKIYREALDSYLSNPKKYKYDPKWKEELQKISHRNYTTGFYFGDTDRENIKGSEYVRDHAFVGVVGKHSSLGLEVFGRNRFAKGDDLEIIDPNAKEIITFKVKSIKQGDDYLQKAHNGYHVMVEGTLPHKVSQYSLLRKRINNA